MIKLEFHKEEKKEEESFRKVTEKKTEGVKKGYKEHSQAERLKCFINGAKPALRTTNQKTRTSNIPSGNFRMLTINRRSSNLCKGK